jgi:hypothetical protein
MKAYVLNAQVIEKANSAKKSVLIIIMQTKLREHVNYVMTNVKSVEVQGRIIV